MTQRPNGTRIGWLFSLRLGSGQPVSMGSVDFPLGSR